MSHTRSFPVVILSVFAIVFASCDTDDDELNIEENSPYHLKEIQWTLREGDGQEIIEKELPKQVYRNEGDTVMPLTVEPMGKLQAMSRFDLGDLQTVLDINEVKVSIPLHVELLGESYSYVGGGEKVPFQSNEYYFPFSWSMTDSFTLNPHTQITFEGTVSLKKITATYKARFEQEGAFKSYEYEGKWTGIFFYSTNTHSVYEEIE